MHISPSNNNSVSSLDSNPILNLLRHTRIILPLWLCVVILSFSFGCSDEHPTNPSSQVLAERALEKYQSDVLSEIRSQARLVFASMAVTKTAVADDSKIWGKKIGLYSFDTYLRAYIDLSQLKPEDIKWDDEAKSVLVTLPPVEIEIAGRDMTLREDYTNIGLLRSSFDSRDRAKAKEHANRDFRREFERDSSFRKILEDQARRKAQAYFKSFFSANGFTATIDFRK